MHTRSWRWPLAAGLSLALSLAAAERPVRAHAIESSLERVSGLTDSLVLQSRFSPEQPASDAEVRLVSPSGQSIALGRTDASGSLRFRLPEGVGADWELQVDQGPGHRDYLELPAAHGQAQPARQASLVERAWWSGQAMLREAQPLALAGLVALGGLGGAVALRRRRR
ncbi:MAG: hypothetical protein ACKO7Z_08420 [Cyanobacteriota bacterium]